MNEQEMKQTALATIEQANNFIISTQQDYDNAAEVCKEIKYRANQITDYWKPIKEKAYSSWKEVCNKEKELSEPFTKAESDIKAKMTAFQHAKLEEERLLREEQERWKKEQADKLLQEAAKAESEGKVEHSDYLVELAEQTQNMAFEAPKQHKTIGTATKTVWKARIANASLVPITAAGAIIRPIDESVLNSFAKVTKGNLEIPGVEFYEDVQIAVRTR
jgi:hypothetical protein